MKIFWILRQFIPNPLQRPIHYLTTDRESNSGWGPQREKDGPIVQDRETKESGVIYFLRS